MSATEIIWMSHITTIEHLKEHSPSQVRRYLTDTKDYTALTEWDKSRMKESSVD